MISIINLRNGTHPNAVYVGRGRHSALGNPYQLESEALRDNIVQRYRWWLWEKINSRDERVCKELAKLVVHYNTTGELILAYWGYPKNCYVQVIAHCVEWLVQRYDKKRVKHPEAADYILSLGVK